MVKCLRDVEKIFLAGNAQVETKADLAKIVEEPCLAVCEELYDKNILTYWSSANKEAPNEAYVMICYESLDDNNKAIADRLIAEGKLRKDNRFESWNSFDGQYGQALYLGIQTNLDMPVVKISEQLCQIAKEFDLQDIKYNVYTAQYLAESAIGNKNRTEFGFPDLKTAICGDDYKTHKDSFSPQHRLYDIIRCSLYNKKSQDLLPNNMQSIADKIGWIYDKNENKLFKDQETIRRHNNYLQFKKKQNRLDAPNGILMPTLESFYERTNLAISTQPQEGRHFFLPGKGWGTEIAIRGQVQGRKKHSKYLQAIPYRSHADFELYSVPQNFAYTPEFKDLFGGQETYDETYTKKLGKRKPIPLGYIKENAETTSLNGVEIKTLNLEFLLAEKLISEDYVFNKPNNHGRDISDSACIALLYDMDVDKVKQIINDFYIQPNSEYIASKISPDNLKTRAQNLIKKINSQKDYEADDRYIAGITNYTKALSAQELKDLYSDESKWNGGKLKSEVALKIVEADFVKYKEEIGKELNEYSKENIFKKTDAFFRAVDEGRKAIDRDMAKTGKIISANKSRTAVQK